MSDHLAKSLTLCDTARAWRLEKTGVSLATQEVLDFQLAHAQARDAVHAVLDASSLMEGLRQRNLPARLLRSSARNRAVYLRHPGLGRSLSPESVSTIAGATL